MWLDRVEWPVRRLHWLDVGWALFSLANLGGMLLFGTWETVPFHFIWVSLTLVYGFRVWSLRPTIFTLAAVSLQLLLQLVAVTGRHCLQLDEGSPPKGRTQPRGQAAAAEPGLARNRPEGLSLRRHRFTSGPRGPGLRSRGEPRVPVRGPVVDGCIDF